MARPQTEKTKHAQALQQQLEPQPPPQQASQAASPEVVALYAQLVRRDMYPAYMTGVQQNGIMTDVPLAAYRQYVED